MDHPRTAWGAHEAQAVNHNPRRLSSEDFPVADIDGWVRRFPWAACVGAFSLGFLAGLWMD